MNHVAARTLLNYAGDNVALFTFELAQQTLVVYFAKTLRDDLLGRISCDAAKVLWSYIFFRSLTSFFVESYFEDVNRSGLLV